MAEARCCSLHWKGSFCASVPDSVDMHITTHAKTSTLRSYQQASFTASHPKLNSTMNAQNSSHHPRNDLFIPLFPPFLTRRRARRVDTKKSQPISHGAYTSFRPKPFFVGGCGGVVGGQNGAACVTCGRPECGNRGSPKACTCVSLSGSKGVCVCARVDNVNAKSQETRACLSSLALAYPLCRLVLNRLACMDIHQPFNLSVKKLQMGE